MTTAPRAHARVRVAFVDVDSSQRIHFTAMFRYMEVAEHELMRAIGMPYIEHMTDFAYPRVHLSCDLRAAAVYDDMLDVEARVERVGSSSWTVAFTARRIHPARDDLVDAVLIAEGRMTIVTMDPATERAVPLPEPLRRALEGAGSE